MKKVTVHLKEASSEMSYDNVENTYQKGGMFCVLRKPKKGPRVVYKYPMSSIFRVIEQYD